MCYSRIYKKHEVITDYDQSYEYNKHFDEITTGEGL